MKDASTTASFFAGITNLNSSYGFQIENVEEKEQGKKDIRIITTKPANNGVNHGTDWKSKHIY